MKIFKITKNEENSILKLFLFEKFNKQISISKICKEIKKGNIKINNNKTDFNYVLKKNDEIKIYFKNEALLKEKKFVFLKSKDHLNIVYEDKNIIIVNKPRGLICQPDSKQKIDTLNNRIKKYLYLKNDLCFNESNLCHRLDKYTTGLCIAGKTKENIKEINKHWNTNSIKKTYLCLAYGVFHKKKKTLVDFIKKDFLNKKMVIDLNNEFNSKIITTYEVIKQYQDHALLKVNLETGKKHQIRLHLSSIGHPILGDTKYNKINNLNYLFPCLISYKIQFEFPKNHKLFYLNNLKFEIEKIKFK